MRIERYHENHVAAVLAFNRRMKKGGAAQTLARSPVAKWLPIGPGEELFQEFFLVLDDAGVHGGYTLKHQPFLLDQERVPIADYRFPLSEGIIDPKYGMVGLLTAKDAVRRVPLAFGLGMGSRSEPVARLLEILKWKMVDCPFFFRVCHPQRFLRGIAFLRHRASRRRMLDALAFSGIGWTSIKLVHAARNRTVFRRRVDARAVETFGPECDRIWELAQPAYRLVAFRDQRNLVRLYPRDEKRFHRILVRQQEQDIGWAVMLDTQMDRHKQFGSLRVGTVVDVLSVPGAESVIIAEATRYLARRGVDLIVSNQRHEDWCNAFRRSGYLEGPSNFIFAAAPDLAARLEPFEESCRRVHMTRGDGDGPINL